MKFLFGGDVHIGDAGIKPGPKIRSLVANHDHFCINLESAFWDCATPCKDKEVVLRTPTKKTNELRSLGANIVSLANNHVCDFGPASLEQTLAELASNDISVIGAGTSVREAFRPLIVEHDAGHVGLIAYCSSDIGGVSPNVEGHGSALIEDDPKLAHLRDLSSRTDTTICIVHWGLTNYHHPTPEQISLAGDLIAAGADYIIGHHPHVLQGAIRSGSGHTYFSLGNLAFNKYTKRRVAVNFSKHNLIGMLVSIDTDRKAEEPRLHFTSFDPHSFRLDLVEEQDYEALQERHYSLSNGLSSPNYSTRYKWIVAKRMLQRLTHWAKPRNWRFIGRGQVASLLHAFGLYRR